MRGSDMGRCKCDQKYPKCTATHHTWEEPEGIQCDFVQGHPKIHDNEGQEWDHAHPTRSVYWNEEKAPSLCGVLSPDKQVSCSLSVGHDKVKHPASGVIYDHFIGVGRVEIYWNEDSEIQEEPKILSEHVIYRAVPITPQAQKHWAEIGHRKIESKQDYPTWGTRTATEAQIFKWVDEHYPGYSIQKQRSVTYAWEDVQ